MIALAYATLGDVIKIEMILSLLHSPRGPRQVQSRVAGIIDHLHWQSLLAQSLAISCHSLTYIGHLGQCDTDRIVSIYVTPPKVAKASN
jgi:hypothetical protein